MGLLTIMRLGAFGGDRCRRVLSTAPCGHGSFGDSSANRLGDIVLENPRPHGRGYSPWRVSPGPVAGSQSLLVLPASAQGFVELYYAQDFIAIQLCQDQLGLE